MVRTSHLTDQELYRELNRRYVDWATSPADTPMDQRLVKLLGEANRRAKAPGTRSYCPECGQELP